MIKVTVEPFNFIGISVKTTNEDGKAALDLAKLWHRFHAEKIMSKIPHKADNEIYALYTDYEGDYTKPYKAMIGCKVNDVLVIPQGMESKNIKGGDYLMFSPRGKLVEIVMNEWIKIWGTEFDRAYTTDFEVYGKKARDPENAQVDIYVSI